MRMGTRARSRCRLISVAELVDREIDIAGPNKASWSKSAGGLRLDVWRHRYWREKKEDFGHRSVDFRIAANDNPLAAGRFIEWSAPPVSFLDDFLLAADGQSQADYDTADILIDAWGDEDLPFNYGTVVRFERLAIKSTSRSPDVWSLISELIGREFARRGSLLMLKAFPLEYEGRASADSPAAIRKRFRRRCIAMRRYYAHRLGMSAVPGPYGEEGWMWRALKFCPEPSIEKRKRW